MNRQQMLSQLKQIEEITAAKPAYYGPDGLFRLSIDEANSQLDALKIKEFLMGDEPFCIQESLSLFRLENKDQCFGVLVLSNKLDRMDVVGQLAAGQFAIALAGGKEGMDRSTFISRLLMNELVQVDVEDTARRLRMEPQALRCVYLIETDKHLTAAIRETVKNLYPESRRHYLAIIDERKLALVYDCEGLSKEDLRDVACTLVDMLGMENLCTARVAYSTPISNLHHLPQALREADAAMEVGKIFNCDENVSAYSSLGIGRLIYQLPRPLCHLYLNELFDGELPSVLDEETLNLVEVFFKNSLNISETARKLYIHRNTLIYRLDKIQKETGLDLRTFDDALSLKIALLLRAFINYTDKQ